MHTSFAVVPPLIKVSTTVRHVHTMGKLLNSCVLGKSVYENFGTRHSFKQPLQGSYSLSPLGRVGYSRTSEGCGGRVSGAEKKDESEQPSETLEQNQSP